ncbi:MAG: hypothetical protein QG592_465 [Pseudomonadota bacterium]|nr:hypothetical protein [Pseudomonadota bacterium]
MADTKPHGKCKVCGSALMRAHEHWMKEPTIICLPCEQKDKQEHKAKLAYDAKVENWT